MRMASVSKHLEVKRKNESFVQFLDGSGYCEWQITGTFYAGLHLMHAYLHNQHRVKDRQMENHRALFGAIGKHCSTEILEDYRYLYNQSILVRYNCISVSSIRVQYVKEEYKLLNKLCVINPDESIPPTA